MVRQLIILGTSGLAREIATIVEQINAIDPRWQLHGFIGQDLSEAGRVIGSAPVLGDDDWLLAQQFEADLAVAIGYPAMRAKVVEKYLAEDRFSFPNVIHPSAIVGPRVEIGSGNIVAAGCVFTCDIGIGDFNIFNVHTLVGHDTRIGNFGVFNAVTVSGGVTIGDRVLGGLGSRIVENRLVGDDATIGAGAVVVRDVAAGDTVVGVPAKPLRKPEP